MSSLKTLPNLIDLKIDIQNQEQSLSVLTMLPKLLMLNGTSTKAEVPCAVIDLDDAETTEISLDNEKPIFTEIYSAVSEKLKSISSEEGEKFLLSNSKNGRIMVDELKINKEFKKRKIRIMDTLRKLEKEGVVKCTEMRYDFKNTKISTGLNGINRIFLPSSKIYPTLVASDTNDYISTEELKAANAKQWKDNFMKEIYNKKKFRKITKSEACKIQGFPADFKLPDSRPRWMHLIGNSVAVPVVTMLTRSIVSTGVFDENDWNGTMPTLIQKNIGILPIKKAETVQMELELKFD